MAVVCGPYFKGWFFGRGREGGSARVAARGGRREGWRALPAMQSSQKYSSSSSGNPHDRPRLYTGSPNPLIRVDSHDRLEGCPPTNLPLLIQPSLPSGPPTTHPFSTASSTTSSWPALWFATCLTNDLRLKNDGFSLSFLSSILSVVLLFSLNYNLGTTIYFRSLAFFHGRTSARRSSNLSTAGTEVAAFTPFPRFLSTTAKPREIHHGSRLDWLTIPRTKSSEFLANFPLVPPISNFDLLSLGRCYFSLHFSLAFYS